MSTETRRPVSDSYGRAVDMVVGGASGLVAGIVGGIGLQAIGSSHVLTRAMPALVGLPTPAPAAGWLLFVLASLGLGLLYAGLLATAGRGITDPVRGLLAGTVYGLALWLTVAVVFVPLATGTAGYAGAPAFPYVDPVALVGYVVYGAAVGVFCAALAGYRGTDTGSGSDLAT